MKGGEIDQVDGGHILRATGRKDRHSKVYTAKGPRDRRVRLAAHTAIQFYDVQDRLGYDRPSKAVDWLIHKAQTAIDKLNEAAPPWKPGGCSHTPTPDSNPSSSDLAMDHPSEESFFPTSSFAGFGNDPCQAEGEDLGLSLQPLNSNLPYQESFQRIDGWNNGDGGDHSRVGILLNSQQPIFPIARREIIPSNAAINPWNQRPLIPTNHHLDPRTAKSSNFESPFELGFRAPAWIYGDQEAENQRSNPIN